MKGIFYQNQFYRSLINRLGEAQSLEDKNKILGEYKNASSKMSFPKSDILTLPHQTEQENLFWALNNNRHLSSILHKLDIFLNRPELKELVKKFLFYELDFFGVGYDFEYKKELFKRLTGEDYDGN